MLPQPINNEYKYGEEEEDSIVSDFIFKYLPFWPLFVAFVLIGVSAAYIYLRYKVPVYEVSANILIKDEKKGINSSSILESLDMFGSAKIVENEIEVLKSRDLGKQVVTNVRLYAPIYQEGKVNDVSAYLISPVLLEAKDPYKIEDGKKTYFSYNKTTGEVKVGNNKFSINTWFVLNGDTLRFIPNPRYRVNSDTKPLYFSLVSLRRAVGGLLGNIAIAPVSKQATVISLKMRDQVPARGEDVLNELIKVYNQAAIKDKNSLAANTLAFVEDRLKYVVKELGEVETAIQQYKTKKGIVDISTQGKMFLGSVESNDQQVAQMNMQLAVLKQVEKYVLTKDGNTGIVPSTLGVNDPVLSQLLQTLYELQLQYEKLKKTTAENNPILISVQDQIEKVRPNILENISNQRNSLIAGKSNLESNNLRYSSMLRTVPQKERELLEISREQAIKNNIYTFLLQKREETALSFASTVADSRLVDQAEASLSPVSPKRNMIYLIAVGIGLAAAIGIIYIRELLNQTILFRNEIEKQVSWPIIGEVSFQPGKEAIVVGEGKRNLIAEQFRQIRTTLDYLGINVDRKKILVTSSISGEGKSFIAANMAVSLALTGKKVVLLELDLRKPKLSPLFNLTTGAGITNYLIGKAGLAEIIKKTAVNENLYFIPSGPIPPNPSELLLNGRVNELLEFLENEFDYILMDTAPVAPVTDGHILSKFSDTTLYIVRHGYTPKIHVKRLEENNKIRGLKNVAIIFNGLKERGFTKYGCGYGYGYGYGYEGYTNDESSGQKKKFLSRIISFFNF